MGSMLFTIMAAWRRWNTRSNRNASPTRSANAEPLARILAAGPSGSPIVRSAAPSASSKEAHRPPRPLATSEYPARLSTEGHEPSPTSPSAQTRPTPRGHRTPPKSGEIPQLGCSPTLHPVLHSLQRPRWRIRTRRGRPARVARVIRTADA